MNLDENTKSALDAGQTIVLSGGYIVMSPETFRYALETSCKETLHAVFDEEVPDQDSAFGDVNANRVHVSTSHTNPQPEPIFFSLPIQSIG